MRVKLIASVTVVAFTGATVFSCIPNASAKKPKVIPLFRELSTGRVLEPGNPLQLKAKNVLIATSSGNISCEDGRLGGPLQNNGFKTDGFLVNSGAFHDAGGGPCASTTGLGTAAITTTPPKGGWPGQARTNGKAKVTGPLVFTVVFEAPGMTVTCTWSANKLKATFIPNGTPIEVRISSAKFKRVGNLAACPKDAFLSGDFEMTTPEPGVGKQTAVSMS